jgi:hypothetical protein
MAIYKILFCSFLKIDTKGDGMEATIIATSTIYKTLYAAVVFSRNIKITHLEEESPVETIIKSGAGFSPQIIYGWTLDNYPCDISFMSVTGISLDK